MNRRHLCLPTAGVALFVVLSCLPGTALHADESSRNHALRYVQPDGCEKPAFSHVRASFDEDEHNLNKLNLYQSCLSAHGKTLMSDFMSLAKELKAGGAQDEVHTISEKMKSIVASMRELKALSTEATTRLQWMHNGSSVEQLRQRAQ